MGCPDKARETYVRHAVLCRTCQERRIRCEVGQSLLNAAVEAIYGPITTAPRRENKD